MKIKDRSDKRFIIMGPLFTHGEGVRQCDKIVQKRTLSGREGNRNFSGSFGEFVWNWNFMGIIVEF